MVSRWFMWAAAVSSLAVVGLACGGSDSESEAKPGLGLETAPPDFDSTPCAGVVLRAIRLQLEQSGAFVGFLVNPQPPRDVIEGPVTLAWPAGYATAVVDDQTVVTSADGEVIAEDGTILRDVGACLAPAGYFIVDPGTRLE